jgi:hypothetical protein
VARARNIKPGFYQNDVLAECSVWARMIFPGLWMLADRDGKLEDRPARIKAALLPYDGQNVDKLLGELAARGFIRRYDADGQKYIQISNFRKHQNPHCKEPESTIPDPPDCERHEGQIHVENCAGTVQEPDAHSSGPADSGFRIPSPDSPSRIVRNRGGSGACLEDLVVPEGIDTPAFREAWGRWQDHRREIGHPLKPAGAKTLLKKLADVGPAEAVERIDRAVANGWRGLFFANEEANGTRNNPRGPAGRGHGPTRVAGRIYDDDPAAPGDRPPPAGAPPPGRPHPAGEGAGPDPG